MKIKVRTQQLKMSTHEIEIKNQDQIRQITKQFY
jgi:hypothetical protein